MIVVYEDNSVVLKDGDGKLVAFLFTLNMAVPEIDGVYGKIKTAEVDAVLSERFAQNKATA